MIRLEDIFGKTPVMPASKRAEYLYPILQNNELDGQQLSDVICSELHLEHCYFFKCALKACKFEKVEFTATDFQDCKIVDTRFQHIEFYWISFFSTTFENCKFQNVDFKGAIFDKVTFKGCSFNNVKFSTCNLGSVSSFEDTEFANCNLNRTSVEVRGDEGGLTPWHPNLEIFAL